MKSLYRIAFATIVSGLCFSSLALANNDARYCSKQTRTASPSTRYNNNETCGNGPRTTAEQSARQTFWKGVANNGTDPEKTSAQFALQSDRPRWWVGTLQGIINKYCHKSIRTDGKIGVETLGTLVQCEQDVYKGTIKKQNSNLFGNGTNTSSAVATSTATQGNGAVANVSKEPKNTSTIDGEKVTKGAKWNVDQPQNTKNSQWSDAVNNKNWNDDKKGNNNEQWNDNQKGKGGKSGENSNKPPKKCGDNCPKENENKKKACLGLDEKQYGNVDYYTQKYKVGRGGKGEPICMRNEVNGSACYYVGKTLESKINIPKFKFSQYDFCCGIKLNTDVPFVGRCISNDKEAIAADDAPSPETAFVVLIKALTTIVMTLIMVGSVIMLIISGVMIASGNYTDGKALIIKVVISLVLLGASGIILRLINPIAFT